MPSGIDRGEARRSRRPRRRRAPPGPLAHQLHALAPVGHLFDVDRVVGAEGARQLEPPGDLVHHDHRGGAHVLGHRGRLDPEPARALDHHACRRSGARAGAGRRYLGERAVHRGHHLVGQLVRHLEERAARPQVVVVGEGAVEVRERARPDAAARACSGRPPGSWLQARVAAPARIEVGVGDAVALLERPAQRVGLDPRAELGHPAGHLVAEDPAVLGQPQRARRRARSADRSRTCWRRETRISTPSGSTSGIGDLADLERLAGSEEHGGLAVAAMVSAHAARSPELERVVEGAHRELGVLVLDHAGDRDLGGRDHLDVDVLARQRLEHARRHARRGCACPRRRSRPWPPARRRRRPGRPISRAIPPARLGAREIGARQGEGDVGLARRG